MSSMSQCHVGACASLWCILQTPIYLVVETSGSNSEHDYAKLEKFLEEAYEEELIADGTIAQDSTQQAAIWQLRESISEGLRHAGKTSDNRIVGWLNSECG